ncbi:MULTISPECIES: hypothetical protein [Clostridium]|uniref:aspartate-alanine antiporter-like transporter n=1 Tax=Clostridium TaxID=1485 RepID=UPI0008263D71|nr:MULTISPECIES: hypothetical protein [Clostridium]PJI08524.1 hypothetical protein CUB90_11940 [Clostridium sp. CT7]
MFNLGNFIMNPFVLLFAAVFLGILFGKIRIGNFRFGLSGALFSGIALSWSVLTYARNINSSSPVYKTAQQAISKGLISQDLFNLFLMLFICAVGLLAGKDIRGVLKRYGAKLIIVGLVITFTGATLTCIFLKTNKNFNSHEISGIYSGALTSSPGLAASLDAAKGHGNQIASTYTSLSTEQKKNALKIIDKSGKLTPKNTTKLTDEQKSSIIKTLQAYVSSGFTAAFPFGVVTIILSMAILPKIFRIDIEKEKEEFSSAMSEVAADSEKENDKEVSFDLAAFALVCFVGYFLGSINIGLGKLGQFSLGTPGGVLISALVFSNVGKIGMISFRMNGKILGAIRQFGLVCFLATVGLSYGYNVITIFAGSGAKLAGMGLVVVCVAILMGFLVGRYVFKLNWIILAGSICGGMTSTPGLGAAVDATGSDEVATGYGATYPFALIFKVLFITILYKTFLM